MSVLKLQNELKWQNKNRVENVISGLKYHVFWFHRFFGRIRIKF